MRLPGEMPHRFFASAHKPRIPYAVGRAGSISSPPERLTGLQRFADRAFSELSAIYLAIVTLAS